MATPIPNPIVSVFSSGAALDATNEIYWNSFIPALSTGIQAGTITLNPIPYNGDYDTNSQGDILNGATGAKSIPKNSHLIVTVGGLVAAEAVAQLKKHDYPNAVYLIMAGNTPKHNSKLEAQDPANISLLGGIDLESTDRNPARANALVATFATVTDRTKICLYYNSNSHMFAEELTEWDFHVGGGSALFFKSTVKQDNNYDKQQFKDDLTHLPNGTQAVVISSDPFFALKASDLSDVANNNCSVPVCYPGLAYTTMANKSIALGPSMKAAYTALGVKANTYVNALITGNNIPVFMGVDIAT